MKVHPVCSEITWYACKLLLFQVSGHWVAHVAAALEVRLHCWQAACIPRSVQVLSVLSSEKGHDASPLEVSRGSANIERQSRTGAPRLADSNLCLTGNEVKPLAQAHTARRVAPRGPDSQPQALFLSHWLLKFSFLPLPIGVLVNSVLTETIQERGLVA